jgi:hypothetical protein
MENNPYKADYHKYLESLRSDLNNSDSYVRSDKIYDQSFNQGTTSAESKKGLLIRYGLRAVFISIVCVFVLAQGVFFVFDKINAKSNIANDTNQDSVYLEKLNDNLKNVYIRTDLDKDVFATNTKVLASSTEVEVKGLNKLTSSAEIKGLNTYSTSSMFVAISEYFKLKEEKVSDFDITKYFNVNIPGVSRIGYEESLGNSFLTDNINKYSDKTLVIGERGSPDGMSIGGGDILPDDFATDKYDILPKAYIPVLSSKAFLLADLDTGEIILDKKSSDVYPIASVTKLMTSVIATEKMNLQDIAIVSKDATNAYGAQGGLSLGEKIRLSDLIFPLLMESSNDAAEVFADHYGHQNFLDEMNKKADFIGMMNTYFNDPSGLDPKNSSTPNDLLKLVRYIWKNDQSIFNTTRVKQFSIKDHTWLNRNAQLPINGYVGGKNGYIDQALQTTASIFEIPTAKGGVRKVAIIILKSNDKNGDVIKLINFLKNSVVYTP